MSSSFLQDFSIGTTIILTSLLAVPRVGAISIHTSISSSFTSIYSLSPTEVFLKSYPSKLFLPSNISSDNSIFLQYFSLRKLVKIKSSLPNCRKSFEHPGELSISNVSMKT
eukprot:TRINITY_DN29590_c0_g1_i1.p1 TRINITY_DN29590_c0_g1~~TRINITY_DN29590_c0_g1_i1.p1  ORF type:complete len:111 (-),score=13.16 TRINITY_DN29590_c0_g1_i1:267-599(-)